MPDIVAARADAIDRVEYIYQAVDPAGNSDGDKEEANAHSGKYGDSGEHDARYCTRGADRAITPFMPVKEQREEIATDEACEVNEKIIDRTEDEFDTPAEEIKREHVKDQVHPVDMKKAAGNDPFVFFVNEHPLHFEGVACKERMIIQALVGNKDIGDDNGNSDDARAAHDAKITEISKCASKQGKKVKRA